MFTSYFNNHHFYFFLFSFLCYQSSRGILVTKQRKMEIVGKIKEGQRKREIKRWIVHEQKRPLLT